MQLKKLEIQGFKTFVEPVSFNFEYPIVAIVGPNGSGKSNIVDAVKWCMGEQSARQLRANQMSDLIFNGSEHRKSIGMAEVSLAFTNDGTNTPSSYDSFSEVAVTRRMYRGEESEYYLNKDPRRLKDILEFLMDISISSKAFSIIEQGQISEIIDAKPEMRRYVIEDAAGILKYKNRKKVALDKIELTKANIARIADLLSEIKRSVNQVNKQVKVAQEYKTLKDEYRTLELGLFKTEFSDFVVQLEDKKGRLESTRFDLAKVMSQASARYTDHQRFKERLDAQAADISEKQNRINALTSEAMVLQEKIESSKKLKETLQRENERIKSNEEELKRGQASFVEQLKVLEEKLEEEKKGLNTIVETQKLYEQEKNDLGEQINAIKEKIEEERNNEFNRIKKITELENQIISAEHDFENITHRLEKIQHDRTAIELKINALKGEKTDLEKQEKENAAQIAALEEKAASFNKQSMVLDEESGKLADRIEQTKKMHEGVRSRYSTLEDLRKNMDGYSEGTRYVMKQSEQFNISKVVADYIKVKPGYELAVQAVLGDIVQAMVVQDHGTAGSVIDVLRKQDKGRAVFIIKSYFKSAQTGRKEGLISLLDIIEVKDTEVLPVFQVLFNDVYIVSSLPEAYAVAGQGATAVTMSGDVVKPGIVSGGSEGTIKGGILDRRSELERLKRELDDMTGTLSRYEDDRAKLSAGIAGFRSELAEQERLRQDIEKQQSSIKAKLMSLDDQLNNYESSLMTLHMEEEEIKVNTSELLEEVSDLKQKKAIYEEDKGAKANIADSLRNTLAELESVLEHKKDSISESNANLAAFKERLNAKYAEVKRIKTEQEDINRKLASLKQEASNNSKRLETMDQDAISAAGKLAGMNQDIQQRQNTIVDARTSYDREFKEYTDIEQEIKQLEKDISSIKAAESSLAIEVSQLTMKTDYTRDTARDKYGVELEQYDGAPVEKDDIQAGKDRISLLSEKIAKMGDVNVGAIAEYEELQKRVEFYEKHKQDLEQAIDNLKKVINSINKESRKLFREIFDMVNENFKKVIPKLFDGGKGELILTDEQDLLESGMEIVIQPLGKRLQNINLLSGGEKALSAIALLISVFMVKPSPFALLDEIDAPLDDASVGKLNNVIKELSTKSQFLLITHNKRTIEIADVIYGITMEEPGVSKIISVKLQKEAV